MIVCKQCGHHNEDSDTFCGSCGRFLEWTGERIAVQAPPPEPIPEPEPEPSRLSLIDRVKHAVGIDESPAAATSRPESTSAPEPVGAAASVSPAAPIANTTTAAPVSAASSPPAAGLAPAAATLSAPAAVGAPPAAQVGAAAAPARSDEPISRRPTAVAPTITRPRPGPKTTEPPTRHQPGDLICGQCGEGNDPERHFCRRCGHTLDESLRVQLPWYRRLFAGRRRPTREAGWRPGRVGGISIMGTLLRVVRLAAGLAVILFLILFLLVPQFHDQAVRDINKAYTTVRIAIHPHYDTVTLVAASASSAIPGHGPRLSIDGALNTYWAARVNDPQPVLRITFARPTDIARVLILSGPSGAGPLDAFKNQPRPWQVQFVFSTGQVVTLNLKDEPGQQDYPLDIKQASGVAIRILSMHPALAGQPVVSSVAITEIEFFTKD